MENCNIKLLSVYLGISFLTFNFGDASAGSKCQNLREIISSSLICLRSIWE